LATLSERKSTGEKSIPAYHVVSADLSMAVQYSAVVAVLRGPFGFVRFIVGSGDIPRVGLPVAD